MQTLERNTAWTLNASAVVVKGALNDLTERAQ